MSIVVRYPGRACLLGEHCDWAGGASLTVPVPLWVEAEAERRGAGLGATSRMEGEFLRGLWPEEGAVEPGGGPLRFVPAAAWLLRERLGLRPGPVHLWMHATLPPGRGLSSSAAASLAALDALARAAGAELGAVELAELAYVLEHDLLGVDCGRLDPLACAAAGPLFLRWERDGTAEPRRLRPGRALHLVVAAFPGGRGAGRILAALSALHALPLDAPDAGAAAVRQAIARWAELAEAGARALEAGDAVALGAAMDAAQRAYEELVEPHVPEARAPRLRAACAELRAAGALGAKFSGAGGDRGLVSLWRDADAARAARERLEAAGLSAWTPTLEVS